MKNRFRTHHIGTLCKSHHKESVRISGWVHSIRDHGGVIFIMLRDQYGIVQVVCREEHSETIAVANQLRAEWVVSIEGVVALRSEETKNLALKTGEIEIVATRISVLSQSKTPPFAIDNDSPVRDEAIRYRYLHLRREKVQQQIILRSRVTKMVRDFLYNEGFHEIETPILTKATPEGARDFLVPSRVFQGEFYALPQSPQQYKQLLMVAGFDKYFQIARALRDEDSRADRQPEHTQIDLEMAFVEKEQIMDLLERMFTHITTALFPQKKIASTPFQRLSFQEAMSLYGNDKPDLRFDLKLIDIKNVFRETQFKIFAPATGDSGLLKAIKVPSLGAKLSRKDLNGLVEIAQRCAMAGVVCATYGQEGWKSTAGAGISKKELNAVAEVAQATSQDLLLLLSSKDKSLLPAFSLFRTEIAKHFGLIDENLLAYAFVVDFPLVEWNEDEKRLVPLHHMFVLPREEDIPLLDSDPAKAVSTQFDVVCNGYELCSGSRRIHTPDLQRKVMRMIGLSDREIDEKFSHLLKAFSYGAPPHGGAAPGLDRLLMVLLGTPNIRDVIAFPKTQRGQDLMMESPSTADDSQLGELGLKIDWDAIKEERRETLRQKQLEQTPADNQE